MRAVKHLCVDVLGSCATETNVMEEPSAETDKQRAKEACVATGAVVQWAQGPRRSLHKVMVSIKLRTPGIGTSIASSRLRVSRGREVRHGSLAHLTVSPLPVPLPQHISAGKWSLPGMPSVDQYN